MSEKKGVVRRPYHGDYQEELDGTDDEEKSESEIKVSESEEPSDTDTATLVENPSDDSTETEELVTESESDETETKEATSETSPVEPEAKVWKKRHDDARRYHNKLNTRIKQLETKLKEKGEVSLPKSEKEIDEWRVKYPDVYDIVSTIAAKQSEEQTANVQKQLVEITEAQEEVTFERAANQIRKIHKDFDDLIADSKFHDWAATQPDAIQNALYENRTDSAAAIRAIDLYKYDQKPVKAKKKDAAQAVTKTKTSDAVEGKEPKIWTEVEIQALSGAEYEKLEEVIDIAAREGRIIRA